MKAKLRYTQAPTEDLLGIRFKIQLTFTLRGDSLKSRRELSMLNEACGLAYNILNPNFEGTTLDEYMVTSGSRNVFVKTVSIDVVVSTEDLETVHWRNFLALRGFFENLVREIRQNERSKYRTPLSDIPPFNN